MMEHRKIFNYDTLQSNSLLGRYQPLLVLLFVMFVSAIALSSTETGSHFVQYFLGLMLVNLSVFKFLQLHQFAQNFATHDFIGKRSKVYAYAFPFIELVLGLLFLSATALPLTYAVTLVLMLISAVGIGMRLLLTQTDSEPIDFGTILNSPLAPVMLVECVIAVCLSAAMLLMY